MDEPVPKFDLALIAITPFVLLGLWYLITKTRVGILVRAATQDREMVGALVASIFVVVVIGGMGSLPGAYIAAVLISVLNVFGVAYLPQSTLVLMFVVMAVVLTIRPYGLLGREEVAGEHGQVGEPETPIKPASAKVRAVVFLFILALATLPHIAAPFFTILATDVIVFCLFAASLHFILGLGGLVTQMRPWN